MTSTETTYLGRCKECNYALFATEADLKPARDFREMKAGAGAYCIVGGRDVFGRCTTGHKVFTLKPVKGTYSAEHQCDARCLNAKGYTCTCSCGGVNHGRGHAAVVKAEDTHEPGFLGEEGKHIVGNVVIKAIRELQDSRLYSFVTDAGDSIKWFAPSFADPQWEQGSRHKIRARVKRHEDHPQYGKSTLVTYVEEVND